MTKSLFSPILWLALAGPTLHPSTLPLQEETDRLCRNERTDFHATKPLTEGGIIRFERQNSFRL